MQRAASSREVREYMMMDWHVMYYKYHGGFYPKMLFGMTIVTSRQQPEGKVLCTCQEHSMTARIMP